MSDEHYPTVDIDFLKSLILECDRYQNSIEVGLTTAFVMTGNSHINKRIITLRDMPDNQVDFMFATGVAYKIRRLGELTAWLEVHRNWKDGGYTA